MRHNIFISVIIMAALAVSCEKQIDIDIDAQQREVVVSAMGDAGDNMAVRLTYSRPVFSTFYVRDGENYFEEINDAAVTLKVNGAAAGAAVCDSGNYLIPYVPQAGDRLELSIAVPGRKTITASAEVPPMPQVGTVTVSGPGGEDQALANSTIKFTLTDPAATADYYSVRVRYHNYAYYELYDTAGVVVERDTAVYDGYLDFSCTDYEVISNAGIDAIDPEDPEAASTFWGDEMFFTDANINGLSHTFVIKPYNSDYYGYEYFDDGNHYDDPTHTWVRTDSMVYSLEVSALSRDSYLYLQSVDAYDYDELGSLFSEPVQIHSNISGGIGIFGVRSRNIQIIPRND